MLGGLSVVLYGIVHDDLARALGGGCLTIAALAIVALVLIRQWIVDTSAERHALIKAQAQAQGEYSRYIALEAALEAGPRRLPGSSGLIM